MIFSGTFARAFGVAGLIAMLWAGPGAAQTGRDQADIWKELEAIKETQATILKEIQSLKTVLLGAVRSGSGPRADAVINVAAAPMLGTPAAPVTLIEFTDLQCPFCGRYAKDTAPRLEREYVATGKVKYVSRDFPIVGLHPQALKAHEAVRCAGDQGRFWEMRTLVFQNQRAMTPADFERHAQTLKLDVAAFRTCLDNGTHAAAIRRDLEEGRAAGVSGTPTFFIGVTDPSGTKFKASRVLTGAQPFDRFKEAIEALLQQSAPQK